jgi:hypothetical protein
MQILNNLIIIVLQKNEVQQNLSNCTPENIRDSAFGISKNAATIRRKRPTQLLDDGTLNIPRRSSYDRRLETLTAATIFLSDKDYIFCLRCYRL